MKSLHKLIHQLSPSEKRYLKIRFKGNKADSLLLNYFQSFVHHPTYNFLEMQREFSATSPKVLQNSFRKLYDSILRHLRTYNASKSAEDVAQGLLADIRTLQDKGMLDEAEKFNSKLIDICTKEEIFHSLKEGIQNKWNFLHLKGKLAVDETSQVKAALNDVFEKEAELNHVNSFYREITTLYYQYFFYERTEKLKKQIVDLCDNDAIKKFEELKSDKSKMTFFEIHSMKSIVEGDILAHHQVRRKQLRLLFTSTVFRNDYLSKLLVLSNTFTYLKANDLLAELKAYLEFLRQYFSPIIEKKSDGVLLEKYYDVYFQNVIYLQNWHLDRLEIETIISEFKELISSSVQKNMLLVSRTYLAISELLIFSQQYKLALQYIIEFQALSLDKKHSEYFSESELHLLMLYKQMDKIDIFDNLVLSIKKRLRSESIVFNQDQQFMFSSFNYYHKGKISKIELYTGKKKWINIYCEVLKGKSMNLAHRSHFQAPNVDFNEAEDLLLKYIKGKQ